MGLLLVAWKRRMACRLGRESMKIPTQGWTSEGRLDGHYFNPYYGLGLLAPHGINLDCGAGRSVYHRCPKPGHALDIRAFRVD